MHTRLPHALDLRPAASSIEACINKPDTRTTRPHRSSSDATGTNNGVNGPRRVLLRQAVTSEHQPPNLSWTGTVDDSGDEDYLPSTSPSSSESQDSQNPRRKQGERCSWCGGGLYLWDPPTHVDVGADSPFLFMGVLPKPADTGNIERGP